MIINMQRGFMVLLKVFFDALGCCVGARLQRGLVLSWPTFPTEIHPTFCKFTTYLASFSMIFNFTTDLVGFYMIVNIKR